MNIATLKSKIAGTLRDELAREWGLPMERYRTRVETDTSYRADTGTVDLWITFTHRTTGATIVIENIIADADAGTILEYYPPKLELA